MYSTPSKEDVDIKKCTADDMTISPLKSNKFLKRTIDNYLSDYRHTLDFNDCSKKRRKNSLMTDKQFRLNKVLCERNCDNDIISFDDKKQEWVIFEFCKYNNVKFKSQKSYSLTEMNGMLATY